MKRAPIIIPSISPFKFKKAHALKTVNAKPKEVLVKKEGKEMPTEQTWSNTFIGYRRLNDKPS